MKAFHFFAALGMIVLLALVYFVPLNSTLLWEPDETRYGEISREMVTSGDWVTPRLLGVRYFEKPVAGYWMNNISLSLFGENNFSVRFAAVFSTLMSALLVFLLARRMQQTGETAFFATLIYLSFLLIMGIGTTSVLDPMLTLWMTAAMFSLYLGLQAKTRQGRMGAYALLGLACGMGFLTKGFLALAIPVLAALPIAIWQKRFKEMLFYSPIAMATALLISLPWALLIAWREPDYWHYFFWVEHIQRFAQENAQHRQPFYFYLPVLLLGAIPWMALVPGAIVQGFRQRVAHPERLFALSWLLVPLLFFSVAKGKLETYILPCMAPLALLMACYAQECVATAKRQVFKINGWLNLGFGVLGIVALVVFASPLFPAIRILMDEEWPKQLLIGTVVLCWLLFAWLSLRREGRHWFLAAGCPLLVLLLWGMAIPQKIVDAKQPQHFIELNRERLSASRYLLANDVGVAAGLAWELKRSDVGLYGDAGELTYGLQYPESKGQQVKQENFYLWLKEVQPQGDVALVVRVGSEEEPAPLGLLVFADEVWRAGRFVLLIYKQGTGSRFGELISGKQAGGQTELPASGAAN